MNESYKLTKLSCFLGIFLQALTVNLIAVLFVPLQNIYHFEYRVLGMLVAVAFGIQVLSDILCAALVDKIGYKKMVVPASVFAITGLLFFALTPQMFSSDKVLTGFIIGTLLMSMASGITEVAISPLAEDLPSKNKDTFMSIVHSFYAWGQVVTIIITTVSLLLIGYENWYYVVGFWTIVPSLCLILFMIAKYPPKLAKSQLMGRKKLIMNKYYILCLVMMFFCGASEVIMNQWASTFMEKSLQVSKIAGDLLGMCGFTIFLGIGRTAYGFFGEKLNLVKLLSLLALGGFICYVLVAISPFTWISILACAISGLFISILWPGCLVVASRKFPTGGAFLFGFIAMFGDLGGSIGPYITGLVVDYSPPALVNSFATLLNITAEQASIRMGILVSAVFPLCACIVAIIITKVKKKNDAEMLLLK